MEKPAGEKKEGNSLYMDWSLSDPVSQSLTSAKEWRKVILKISSSLILNIKKKKIHEGTN